MSTTLERATRLIRVATGEEYGDGMTVMDVGVGIVNGTTDAVWVTGDWNDARTYDNVTQTWAVTDDMPSRLYKALERLDVELHHYDQASPCHECQKLVDTDVTFGLPPSIFVDDCGTVCLECVAKDLNDWAEDYIDNSDKALPDGLDEDTFTAAGWTATKDDHRSGWYGREDSPDEILAKLKEREPEVEVLFQITGAHMFEISFTTWFRVKVEEE